MLTGTGIGIGIAAGLIGSRHSRLHALMLGLLSTRSGPWHEKEEGIRQRFFVMSGTSWSERMSEF